MFYKSYLEISKKYAYMIIILLMYPLLIHKAFPGGSEVKNLPAMRETWVQSLGWEDPMQEGLATQSSILAWRIPMDRGAWQATWCGKSQT